MDIKDIIRQISQNPDCVVFPPEGKLPEVRSSDRLPSDIQEFFTLCSGMKLWISSQYSITIVAPSKFVLANPIVVGELVPEDISSFWYIVAADRQSNYLTVDCNLSRLGRCYDSFFDRHGIVGSCSVIARSFTEMLTQFWNSKGEYWFWLDENFASLGDAYDS